MLRVKGRSVHRTWQGSHGGNSRGLLVAVIVGAEGWRRQRSGDCRFGGCEGRAVEDHLLELGDGSSVGRVELENTTQNSIELKRDGKDRPKERGVLHESAEGAVLGRSTLPRVASTGEVDQDHSETPYIVGSRSIARISLGRSSLTFC